jgi:hypothetical protein
MSAKVIEPEAEVVFLPVSICGPKTSFWIFKPYGNTAR